MLACFRDATTVTAMRIPVQEQWLTPESLRTTILISILTLTPAFKVRAFLDSCMSSMHPLFLGTNKPAHYYVLLDENGFGSDGIQLLTYWMCFLYVRCTRSVSYAPPAYYAHLAALHGRYLTFSDSDASSSMEGGQPPPGTELHPALKERMFFV